MKFIIGAVFIIGIAFGASGFSLQLSVEDLVRHECLNEKQGDVVIFNSVYIEDPLSQNTCGDMHSLSGINL